MSHWNEGNHITLAEHGDVGLVVWLLFKLKRYLTEKIKFSVMVGPAEIQVLSGELKQ